MQAKLRCHPSTPAPLIHSLEASVDWLRDGGLRFSYELSAKMAHIIIPSAKSPSPCDGLWQHTCFEAFLAVPGARGYREFNFSPSGQWAVYDFIDYRQKDNTAAAGKAFPAARISAHADDNRFRLEAVLMPEALPENRPGSRLRLGLCAVLEQSGCRGERHSYWALRHIGERPDFHDRRGFALNFTLPNPLPRK